MEKRVIQYEFVYLGEGQYFDNFFQYINSVFEIYLADIAYFKLGKYSIKYRSRIIKRIIRGEVTWGKDNPFFLADNHAQYAVKYMTAILNNWVMRFSEKDFELIDSVIEYTVKPKNKNSNDFVLNLKKACDYELYEAEIKKYKLIEKEFEKHCYAAFYRNHRYFLKYTFQDSWEGWRKWLTITKCKYIESLYNYGIVIESIILESKTYIEVIKKLKTVLSKYDFYEFSDNHTTMKKYRNERINFAGWSYLLYSGQTNQMGTAISMMESYLAIFDSTGSNYDFAAMYSISKLLCNQETKRHKLWLFALVDREGQLCNTIKSIYDCYPFSGIREVNIIMNSIKQYK